MSNLTTIEIDFDIYKAIETERRSFDEPQYVALRRLLKLPEQKVVEAASVGKPWRDSGVEIPHGSDARMSYLRGTQNFEGKFLDGFLVVNGNRYASLSNAAGTLAKTKDGAPPSLNGWDYWEVRLPGQGKWRRMKDLRPRITRKESRL